MITTSYYEFQIPDLEIPNWVRNLEFGVGNLELMRRESARFAVGGRFHIGQKPVNDVERRNAFTLGFEVGHDAVPKHGRGESLDVFNRYGVASLENRARLGAENEILRGARAGTPLDIVFDKLRCGRA